MPQLQPASWLTAKPPPTLADLRREIDRIDEAMHRLLMERGDIIDTLIATKKTAESGSAFRPAREADMMKRLVERHHGILPLDTAESIWRVIIATFTYVQAPFSVHADLSAGEAAMRDTARFHFGFTVPFVTHMGASGVVAAVAASRGDIGLVPAAAASGAWWTALEGDDAPKIIARLPVRGARRPSGRPAGVRHRAAEPGRAGDRCRDLERARRGLGPGGGARARSINGSDRSAGPRVRRRRAARLGAARPGSTCSPRCW